MDKGAAEEAHRRIDQIFDLLMGLARKGFVDGDDRVLSNNNIGFTDDRAIYVTRSIFSRCGSSTSSSG